MPDIVLTFQKQRAHSLTIGLVNRLGEYASDFPTGTASDLIDTVKQLSIEMQKVADTSDDVKIIELICMAAMQLGSYLTFFDNAHTEQTPSGLVCLVEHLVKCVNPNAPVLLWPQSEYNYTKRDILPLLRRLVENVLPQATQDRIFSRFDSDVYLISFPRIERDNILMHAVFGHEVGHLIADEFLAHELATQEYQQNLTKVMQFVSAMKSSTGAPLTFQEQSRVTDLLLRVRKRGLQELLSDMTEWVFFGPSAVMSSFGILSSTSLDSPPSLPSLYPPDRQRLRLLNKLFRESSIKNSLEAAFNGKQYVLPSIEKKDGRRREFKTISRFFDDLITRRNVKNVQNNVMGRDLTTTKAAFNLFLQSLDQISSVDDDRKIINADPVLKIAYEWIDTTLPIAQSWVEDRLKHAIFDHSTIKDLADLIERLDFSIPPNECGIYPKNSPTSWQLAFLAGWLYKLQGKRLTSQSGEILTHKDMQKVDSLVLRAVESIFLVKRYQSMTEAKP
jgi:hypothetical protein